MKKINCVLLIDDDPTTNFLNQSIITDLNIAKNTKVLTDAHEALHYLQNGCGENCPELILLDIKMPGMNGFEFLEALENIAIENKDKIKVVVLSSSLLTKEVEKSKFLGAADFVSKPLSPNKFVNLVDLHFN